VEKIVQVFHSFEEAGKAEREYYARLTPQERIEIITKLRQQHDPDADQHGFARVYRVAKLERS